MSFVTDQQTTSDELAAIGCLVEVISEVEDPDV
jgi:hypothetical protein